MRKDKAATADKMVIPPSRQGGRKYPWKEMAPGDHLDYRTVVEFDLARRAASNWAGRNNASFSTRVIRDKGVYGRIWRVK